MLGSQRCDVNGTNCRSNGWDQYVDAFRSTEFQNALWVTFKLALITVPLGLALGVGLAVLANKTLSGIGVFRTIFSSTVATSVAVASLMWLFLLQPDVGVLANIGWLNDLFPTIKDPGLLRDPDTALWSVAVSSVWASLGFTFILVTAGLQGIPDELNEAAAIDGATGTVRFWRITLPLLGPTLLFVVIVLTTRAFQAYGEIDLLTDGGPRPREPDDHDDLPDLRQPVDHRQRRRSAGGDRGAAVRACCSVLSLLQLRGDRQAGALCQLTVRPAGARLVGPLHAARHRRLRRAVPRVHDGDRRLQAGRRAARQPARARPFHTRCLR